MVESNRLCGVDDLRSNDLDLLQRPIVAVRLDEAHPLDKVHATLDSAKNRVFPVQPGSRRQSDEELAAVGVFAAVGHAQDSRASVLE